MRWGAGALVLLRIESKRFPIPSIHIGSYLLLLMLALGCSPPCLAETECETKAFSKASSPAAAPQVKPTCGHPSLQRCMKVAKADMKACSSQTCGAVLKDGPPKRRAQAQGSGDQGKEAWLRELEELVAALGKGEPLANDDIDMSTVSALRNFPQQPPNSTLEEQMALVRNMLEKGESGNVTCADFTEFFDRTVQTFMYGELSSRYRKGFGDAKTTRIRRNFIHPNHTGMGNYAVVIGRLLGQGAALALGTSNGQSIGDVAGPGAYMGLTKKMGCLPPQADDGNP